MDSSFVHAPDHFGKVIGPLTDPADALRHRPRQLPQGLMTWSINWDGSRNWTFGNNVKSLQAAERSDHPHPDSLATTASASPLAHLTSVACS
ncbi:hypothetical protein [Nocardia sp. XZ_19_369]|uniref:hypothetical protein n=1 Tax=Nocardia sp. XZ_19_369 TaxID=2769487 RepID=UPI00188F0DB3|nr:hypothetical protein [Nocardia sp. XZ_19_369]